MTRKSGLQCCLGCGRDTHSVSGYCLRCIGREPFDNRRGGNPARPPADLPLEDDYSEESNADSVCNDNSASFQPTACARR